MVKINEKNYLTMREAIEKTKLGDSAIRYRILKGEIKAIKVGNQWLIEEESLKKYEK